MVQTSYMWLLVKMCQRSTPSLNFWGLHVGVESQGSPPTGPWLVRTWRAEGRDLASDSTCFECVKSPWNFHFGRRVSLRPVEKFFFGYICFNQIVTDFKSNCVFFWFPFQGSRFSCGRPRRSRCLVVVLARRMPRDHSPPHVVVSQRNRYHWGDYLHMPFFPGEWIAAIYPNLLH